MATLTVVYPRGLDLCDPAIVAATSSKEQSAVALVVAVDEEHDKAKLTALQHELRVNGVYVETVPIFGDRADALIGLVKHYDADLLIKTARPEHHRRFSVYGSTAQKLLREATCPVWIARDKDGLLPTRILAAVCPRENLDECALELEVLDVASRVASDWDAELHVVHAWTPARALAHSRLGSSVALRHHRAAEKREARRNLRQLIEPYDIDPSRVLLRQGPAADVIAAVSREVNADLVVVGSAARTGVTGFMFGNTVEDVLRQSGRSLVGVREVDNRYTIPTAVATREG